LQALARVKKENEKYQFVDEVDECDIWDIRYAVAQTTVWLYKYSINVILVSDLQYSHLLEN